MIIRTLLFKLLAFPIGLMGLVQVVFAFLSYLIFNDKQEYSFLLPGLPIIILAQLLLLATRRHAFVKVGYREALVFACSAWALCGILGSLPIILVTGITFTDGVFESLSALTTTGATVLSGLDEMPKTFLLYRQFMQWLGGLGVVVFVVAVLPMLNVGGMKLLKAETPGPMKDEKLTPRIAYTTRYLWVVYLLLTLGCSLSYYLGGMSFFDAVAHSLSTVSTGGFSTHDQSFSYFHSPGLQLISDVFMLLGAVSFMLHFRVTKSRMPINYWRDEETRWFMCLILLLSILVSWCLYQRGSYTSFATLLNDSVFILVSFITSTGYGVAEFTEWPAFAVALLLLAGYLGGCTGSTAGGNKIIRSVLCLKLIRTEIYRLVHPHGVFSVRYQGKPVDSAVLNATVAFLTLVILSSALLTLLLSATGLDAFSSFTAVAACLNVLGPAFGTLGSNFQPVSDCGTWILSGAMLLGRLEYFTLLALLFPRFWQ